jgi:hypothetical protein
MQKAPFHFWKGGFQEILIICMLWTCLDIQHIRRSPLVAICRADFVSDLHDFDVEPRDRPFKSALHAVEPRDRPFKSALHAVEPRDRPFKPSFDLIYALRDCSCIGFVEGWESGSISGREKTSPSHPELGRKFSSALFPSFGFLQTCCRHSKSSPRNAFCAPCGRSCC